jgi:eukaryotic-like serine/threonine-protein kinase
MANANRQLLTLFGEALECGSPEEQAAYLDRACHDDADLRGRLEALLRAHQDAGRFLAGQSPEASAAATSAEPLQVEQPGTVIGPYKLIQQIGEGGMGTVYMAQQTEPVKRAVALKIIKAGMDTRQVIARFEAERQALAIMDHPNIAKVLDAGTTGEPAAQARETKALGLASAAGSGRPYFVMELVKGVSITKYCDEHRLTPRQRLELFIPVCQAVQHAHQKGIIHRDLKPSNILVAQYDGRPVPKVIDFGVAKAAGQQLTDKTLMTGFGSLIGTLEYMSPEQAEINQLDIDTRSDIYSLGVVMYELLTGSTPLDPKRLKQAAFTEMLRIIREEEPPKPSTRLSDSTDSLPSISAQRHMEPAKLTRSLRGELDWIVMKALEKDRSRRYETANGFAMDVQRYLADEPVQACPPSVVYRFRKFARRNTARLTLAAVVGLALVLVLSVVAGSIGWAARDQAARQSEGERRAEVALGEAGRLLEEEKWPEALSFVGQAEAILRSSNGGADLLGQADRLRQHVEMAQSLEVARLSRATTKDGQIDWQGSDAAYVEAFEKYGLDEDGLDSPGAAGRVRASPISGQLTAALDDWASVGTRLNTKGWQRRLALARAADPDPWRNRLRDALEWQDLRALGEVIESAPDDWPPATLVLAGRLAQHSALAEQAAALLQRAQQKNPSDLWINDFLGKVYLDLHRPDEAAHYSGIAVALRPRSSATRTDLGNALDSQGKLDEAIAEYRKAIDLDPKYPYAHCNLGNVLAKQNKPDEAIAEYRKAIDLDPKNAISHFNLGVALVGQRKLDEAVGEYRKAIDLDPKHANSHTNLGIALDGQGQLGEAVREHRKAIDLDPKCAPAHANLGAALCEQGKPDEAIAECRKAIDLDPKYAPAHANLGGALLEQGKPGEAIALCRKAIELDPKSAVAHCNLGIALDKPDEAIAEYRKAIELDPNLALAHVNLGIALVKKKQLDEAIKEFRAGIELDPRVGWPKVGWGHVQLGLALLDLKQFDEAIKVYRAAIELDPTRAWGHVNLGMALHANNQPDEAVEELRKAIELDPNLTDAHINLGAVLYHNKQPDEAIREWRTAIKLDPKRALAHQNLGVVLAKQGRLDDAIAELQQVVAINRKDAVAHLSLGTALEKQGRTAEAEAEYREALRLRPDFPEAHLYLGGILQNQGRFAEALVAYKRGDELGSKQPNWRNPSAERVRQAEQLVAFDAKLSQILRGEERPANAAERLALAHFCQEHKKLNAAAARFYAEAFAAEPKLADDLNAHRYNAARAAALAGCGQGEDAAKLDDVERARLRRQALGWLRADLAAWVQLLEKDPEKARANLQETIQHWQQETDFGALRGDALAKLPEAERQAWGELWRDVEKILTKVQGMRSPAK